MLTEVVIQRTGSRLLRPHDEEIREIAGSRRGHAQCARRLLRQLAGRGAEEVRGEGALPE